MLQATGSGWRGPWNPGLPASKAPSPSPAPVASLPISQAFPSQQKRRLEGLVWRPLCSLAKALVGPQNLIKKRLDKLLDFERVEEKLLEAGSVTYEEAAARHTYQALNSLLVAELPQFNGLAMQWLGQILRTFVALQKDLAEQVLQRAEGSVAQVRPGHLWGTAGKAQPASPLIAGCHGAPL